MDASHQVISPVFTGVKVPSQFKLQYLLYVEVKWEVAATSQLGPRIVFYLIRWIHLSEYLVLCYLQTSVSGTVLWLSTDFLFYLEKVTSTLCIWLFLLPLPFLFMFPVFSGFTPVSFPFVPRSCSVLDSFFCPLIVSFYFCSFKASLMCAFI